MDRFLQIIFKKKIYIDWEEIHAPLTWPLNHFKSGGSHPSSSSSSQKGGNRKGLTELQQLHKERQVN